MSEHRVNPIFVRRGRLSADRMFRLTLLEILHALWLSPGYVTADQEED